MAAKAQTHTYTLAFVGVMTICWNPKALITRDNKGETPIDIAHRSGACAEIIGLLSITPEEVRSLKWKGMARLYAPVAYWRSEMNGWIRSRSYADCHKFINEHDAELVREVLKFFNFDLLRKIAANSQVYSDSLVFLALRMIHRHPLSLVAKDHSWPQGATLLDYSQDQEACREIVNILRLTPKYISSTPYPTLLRQHLPKQFVDEEIFGVYNTACTFIKHMKYDKAELVEVEAVLQPQSLIHRMLGLVIFPGVALVQDPHVRNLHEGMLPHMRVLHEGMLLLNRCIQEPGAGDGPTSVVLDFLRNDSDLECKKQEIK